MYTSPTLGGPRPAASLDSIPAVSIATEDEMRERIRRKSRRKGLQVDDASLLAWLAVDISLAWGVYRNSLTVAKFF